MKLTDWILNKVDATSLLHYVVSGWIASLALGFGLIPGVIASVLVIAFGFIKEKFLDDSFDMTDMICDILGPMTSFALYFIFNLF